MRKKISLSAGIAFVIGLLCVYVTAAAGHNSTGVMLSSYIDFYHLTSASQGLPGSMESIGLLSSIVLCGLLLVVMKKHNALLLVSALMPVSLVLIGLQPPFPVLCGAYVLFGLAYGCMDSLSSSLISDLYPADSPRIMGYVRAVFGLGGLLLPVVMTAMLHAGLSWNRVLFIMGICGLLLILTYFLLGHRTLDPAQISSPRDSFSPRNILTFLRTPGAIGVFLFCLCYGGHQIGLTVWIIRYITTYMSATSLGEYALTLFWGGAFFSRLILPGLIHSHRIHVVYGNILAAVLLTAGLLTRSGLVLCILMPFVGFAEGSTIPMLVDYACGLDRSRSAIASSIIVLGNNIGGTVVPLLIGLLISAIGPETGIYILPALALGAAGIAAISVKKRG